MLNVAGALTRVSNKLPFLRVALSWKPSFFPLGDLDIGHNKNTLCLLEKHKLLNHVGLNLSRSIRFACLKMFQGDIPGGPRVKHSANAEYAGLIPGLGSPHVSWGD